MIKKNSNVLFYIGNLYIFDEYQNLVIKDLYEHEVNIYLLIDKNIINDNYVQKIHLLKEKKIIKYFWYLEIFGSNKIKNFLNAKYVLKKLGTINFFLTTNLSKKSFPSLKQLNSLYLLTQRSCTYRLCWVFQHFASQVLPT